MTPTVMFQFDRDQTLISELYSNIVCLKYANNRDSKTKKI